MRKINKKSPRRAGVVKISSNTAFEDRLTLTSLLFGYLFDYGVDFQRRVINLTGEVDEEMFMRLDAALSEMEAESPRATVTIKINSPGGYVYQAMAIVGRIRQSKCHIVTCGYGAVMSAATLILASGNKRLISKHAWFMHHESNYTVEGRHSQVKAAVAQSEREEKQWAEWMAQFSKKSKEFWYKNGTNIDSYFTAEELVELGVVDELI